MSEEKWTVNFVVYRKKGEGEPHYQTFTLEVSQMNM